MSLLTIVQKACQRIKIDVPNSVVGNTDEDIVQLLGLANEEGEELAARGQWSGLVQEQTFTQTTAALQGTLDSNGVMTQDDYDYILGDVMWNRTTTLPVLGNVDSRDWQTLQAFPVTGPYQQYKIRGNQLYFDPVPPNATDTIAFEYVSKFWCEDSGGTGQEEWLADDDVSRLDERLMILGLRWRWKAAKGLDYAEEFNTYERRVLNAMGRDTGKRRLRLDGGSNHRVPGVMVPLGSWSL